MTRGSSPSEDAVACIVIGHQMLVWVEFVLFAAHLISHSHLKQTVTHGTLLCGYSKELIAPHDPTV